MSPESRARVLRLVEHIRQSARRPQQSAQDVELMQEYAVRIVDSVVEEEVARRAEGSGGA
jgi:hypothetical protein